MALSFEKLEGFKGREYEFPSLGFGISSVDVSQFPFPFSSRSPFQIYLKHHIWIINKYIYSIHVQICVSQDFLKKIA